MIVHLLPVELSHENLGVRPGPTQTGMLRTVTEVD